LVDLTLCELKRLPSVAPNNAAWWAAVSVPSNSIEGVLVVAIVVYACDTIVVCSLRRSRQSQSITDWSAIYCVQSSSRL